MRTSVFLVALLLRLGATPAAAQMPVDDLRWIAAEREATWARHEESARRGPFGSFLVGSLKVYRAVFSSQDAGTCQFAPSCSHFAEEAIDVYGPLRGGLMASDRLQRCHPGARGYYWTDPATGKRHDPAASYEDATEHSAKSPSLAMAMSAVLPGAGKLYAGRPRDAIYSAFATGVPTTFAALDFRRDGIGSARGWFHASLAVGFYVGNVYGARLAARHAGHEHVPTGRTRPTPSANLGSRLRTTEARDDSTAARELYQRALVSFADGSYPESAARFLDVTERYPQTPFATPARLFQSLSHAQLLSWEAAHRSLLLFRGQGGSAPEVEDALAYLQELPPARRISPTKARILSALVPGSGQFYARRFDKGLMAMLVNGLVVGYVWSTLDTDSFGELALSAAPLFWRYYRGNILSAGRLAQEYNRRREHDQVTVFYEKLGVDLPAPR